MIGDFSGAQLAGALGVVIATAGTIIAARRTGKSSERAAQIAAAGPDWKAFTDSLQAQVNAERAGREATDERVADVERRLAKASRTIRDLRGRYVVSLHHIREWRVWVVRSEGPPPILPDELVVDVDEPPALDDP